MNHKNNSTLLRFYWLEQHKTMVEEVTQPEMVIVIKLLNNNHLNAWCLNVLHCAVTLDKYL